MNETSVNVVRNKISSRVVRIDTAAISSGMNAISEAKTNARTMSAPAAPIRVSTRTPGPLVLLPWSSCCSPVTPVVQPVSFCFSTAFVAAPGGRVEKDVAGRVMSRPTVV